MLPASLALAWKKKLLAPESYKNQYPPVFGAGSGLTVIAW